MWKRVIPSLFICIIILSFSTIGYGKPMDIEDRYQVRTPEENSLLTEKVTVISGKAPEGTDIIIEVYSTSDLTGKNYTLARLPEDEDYVLISSENLKAGDLGFAKEIRLATGINKIMVIFGIEKLPRIERVVYVYDREVAGSAAGGSFLEESIKK